MIPLEKQKMQKIKEENDRKKEYLHQYKESVRRLNRIQDKLDEIKNMRMSISINSDGMPHGSGQSDLSGYAAELDMLERDLEKEMYSRIKLYDEISGQIKNVKNKSEQDVLYYRYIKGLSWWEIAEKMNYSERWIHKLHGKALVHFEFPKEFIEVQ